MLISVGLPVALAIIMFSLGLGLTGADFKRIFKRPVAFMAAFLSQMVLLPMVALGLAIGFGLSPELAVGFMVLAFCPGGVTTNMLTKMANGDVALSVSLTAIMSLLSVITIPVFVSFSIDFFMGSGRANIDITGLAISMVLITCVPVLAGMSVRRFAPYTTLKIEPALYRLSAALFVVVLIGALVASWDVFVGNLPALGPALVVLNLVLFGLGLVIANLLKRNWQEMKTIAIETGIQNGTLGIAVGGFIAVAGAGEGFSSFALPSAVYGIVMYCVTLPIIFLLRLRS